VVSSIPARHRRIAYLTKVLTQVSNVTLLPTKTHSTARPQLRIYGREVLSNRAVLPGQGLVLLV
jgi:hypothetical protein